MDTNVIGSDSVSVSKLSRPSLLRPTGARPAPQGPRTRQMSTLNFENSLSKNDSLDHRNSTLSKTSSRSRESTLYSPGPSSPTFPPLGSPIRSEHDHQAISEIEEELAQEPVPSQSNGKPPPATPSRTPSVILHESPRLPFAPSPAQSRVPSPSPSIPSSLKASPARTVAKQSATLIPAPQIKFENIQIEWKGLPLEAALWTFDSKELQNIVSRAIRSSAQESFIRILSVQQLNETLPAELERLTSRKATMQARYRFHVQRRTMLLQALMSFSDTSGEKDGGLDLVSKLATQISDTTTECDKLTQELVSVTDQITQINKLLDCHWASALAIALRKLNGSYGKRTAELNQAKAKIDQLQAELNDAWVQAEKLAREMDDMDETGVYSDDDGEIMIQRAAVVPIPARPAQHARTASGKLIDLKPSLNPTATSSGSSRPSDLALPVPEPSEEEPVEEADPRSEIAVDDDTRSVHSKRSTKSAKSAKSFGASSRVSQVSAARTRSMRTSLGSLRLPGHNKKPSFSSSGARSAPVGGSHPPVPSIPKVFSPPPSSFNRPTSSPNPPSLSNPSFLNLESSSPSRNASTESLVGGPPHAAPLSPVPEARPRRRTEIEDIKLEPNRHLDASSAERPLSVMDDIIVMPTTSANGIEEVPRITRKSVDDVNMTANSQRKLGRDHHASSTIPSIWLNADAPKTPAERVEAMMRSSTTKTSYTKLKGLTKRYSLPFPFTGKSSASSNKSSSS